ncbi:MAG: DUF1249 domain-containing protein [Halieaceae bacterium]|nr:DUF1249 domain-containing protein [Halieaceae bacterium]
MQKTKKSPYVVSLSSMHSVCETNYIRLSRLFPDYEKSNKRDFFVGSARVCIEVLERCRYTTIFGIQQTGLAKKWITGLSIEMRAYHDASMLEVSKFQANKSVLPKYRYPNLEMHQEDEKNQQNRFLAEWLKNCLANGRTDLEIH